jgi:hypothetical protein
MEVTRGMKHGSMLLAAALGFACGSLDSNNSDFAESVLERPPSGDDDPGGAVGADGVTPEEPEQERESSFRAPVVTGKYVWTANPESGRVAAIDAETFEILSVEAGFLPTHVAALNQADGVPRALVINVGGNDASLLALSSGQITAQTQPLHQGADSWSVGPDGRVAIAWTDSRKAARLDATDGFQDITVLELPQGGDPTATRLTVGYRPSAIAFDSAGARAYAVTQDGISVIELAGGPVRLSRLVSLPSRPGAQPDVSITADGSRALARLDRSSSLFDIELASGQTREIDLGGELTDLDLSADGRRAVAVIRGGSVSSPPAAVPDGGAADAGAFDAGSDGGATTEARASQAVFIDIPEGLAGAAGRSVVSSTTETFGSVALSPDGSHAVLFTTARPSGRITLVGPDLTARAVDLLAAVRAVFVTADGSHALALQDPAPGSLRKGAFSVVSLTQVRAPKLVAADAPTEAVALPPLGSDRALVTVSDPAAGAFGAFLVRMPNLQVDFSSLPSRPLSSGTVPSANKAFVAQAHPEGRITFIDLDEGAGREITGFELSSKVVNE